MSAPRNEEWSFADDVDLLWQAVVEVCGGNVQTEIKEAYRRLHLEQYGEDVATAKRKVKAKRFGYWNEPIVAEPVETPRARGGLCVDIDGASWHRDGDACSKCGFGRNVAP